MFFLVIVGVEIVIIYENLSYLFFIEYCSYFFGGLGVKVAFFFFVVCIKVGVEIVFWVGYFLGDEFKGFFYYCFIGFFIGKLIGFVVEVDELCVVVEYFFKVGYFLLGIGGIVGKIFVEVVV